MIIDCHGHYTTAPPALEAWRTQQINGLTDPTRTPPAPISASATTSCAGASSRTSSG
ncbi:hypothetical protein ACFQ2Y_21585 [Streptomyces malaysiensis subsp. malaysiensis]